MVRRTLILVHRWLGVALCLLFFLWFASGIGMMYFPMPAVTPADRLERAPALDPSAIHLAPAEAARLLSVEVGHLRLTTFDGRPAYRTPRGRTGEGLVLYADMGQRLAAVSTDLMNRTASAWTGQPIDAADVEEIGEVDQWTLQIPLATLGPLVKYAWPNGEQVYVSRASGDVVQYTTTVSRIGAWLGPIPHWIYVTPLRKHGPTWSRVVIWTSGAGTIAAIVGMVIGVWMYSPARKYRQGGQPTSIPYRGQKRWHMAIGLVVGVSAITYAFSGLLSMDPFPSLSARPAAARDRDGIDIRSALSGEMDPAAYDAKHPREVLRQLGDSRVKELELGAFAGEAHYLAHLVGGHTRIVPVHGQPLAGFDPMEVAHTISAATDGRLETSVLDRYDRYYLDRDHLLPLPVVLAQNRGETEIRYYIDPGTARVVGVYDSNNWANRWLYHGLHSLNFPWLYDHRPLWDVLVIALMLGGTALCVTSLVLAWRVLGRTLAPERRSERAPDPAAFDHPA